MAKETVAERLGSICVAQSIGTRRRTRSSQNEGKGAREIGCYIERGVGRSCGEDKSE